MSKSFSSSFSNCPDFLIFVLIADFHNYFNLVLISRFFNYYSQVCIGLAFELYQTELYYFFLKF